MIVGVNRLVHRALHRALKGSGLLFRPDAPHTQTWQKRFYSQREPHSSKRQRLWDPGEGGNGVRRDSGGRMGMALLTETFMGAAGCGRKTSAELLGMKGAVGMCMLSEVPTRYGVQQLRRAQRGVIF